MERTDNRYWDFICRQENLAEAWRKVSDPDLFIEALKVMAAEDSKLLKGVDSVVDAVLEMKLGEQAIIPKLAKDLIKDELIASANETIKNNEEMRRGIIEAIKTVDPRYSDLHRCLEEVKETHLQLNNALFKEGLISKDEFHLVNEYHKEHIDKTLKADPHKQFSSASDIAEKLGLQVSAKLERELLEKTKIAEADLKPAAASSSLKDILANKDQVENIKVLQEINDRLVTTKAAVMKLYSVTQEIIYADKHKNRELVRQLSDPEYSKKLNHNHEKTY